MASPKSTSRIEHSSTEPLADHNMDPASPASPSPSDSDSSSSSRESDASDRTSLEKVSHLTDTREFSPPREKIRSSAPSTSSDEALQHSTGDTIKEPTTLLTDFDIPANDSHHSDSKSNVGSQQSSKHSLGSVQSSVAGSECGSNSTYCYSQEAFETYKLKVSQLCRDIGFGEPSEVEHLKGGSFNRTVGLKFQDRDYVLRVPRAGHYVVEVTTEIKERDKRDGATDIKDQVVVHRYMSEILLVPSIMAFDSTSNNAIASTYILQERIRGTDLDKIYDHLPLSEKLQIATIVAELILKMEQVEVAVPGRFAGSVALPAISNDPLYCAKDIEIGGFRLSKHVSIPTTPKMEKQSLTSFLHTLLNHRHNLGRGSEWMEDHFDKLRKMVLEMESAGLVRTTDDENTIWHWDLAARNIMVDRVISEDKPTTPKEDTDSTYELAMDKAAEDSPSTIREHASRTIVGEPSGQTSKGEWKITGVLDWDGVMSVPRVLTREPPSWLWGDEDEYTWAWYGDRDPPSPRELTSDELLIKAHFDQVMQLASPTYMEDAYYRGPWLRRLAKFAFYGWSSAPDYRFYEILLKEWKEYYAVVSPGHGDYEVEDDGSAAESEEGSESSGDSEDIDNDEEGKEAADGEET